jgi:hypothetical protein
LLPTFTTTSTATSTRTVTPTPTRTTLPSTGFRSPALNQAVSLNAGDKNGYETNPQNAYTADGFYAVDLNSGTGVSTLYSSSQKDKHLFYYYNFSIPAGAVIQGIQVQLDARVDSAIGLPKIYIQLSWNGGANWTAAKTTPLLKTAKSTYLLGSVSDKWGRTWKTADFSATNFRVRVINVASNTSRDFYLDYIAVKVIYRR